MDLFIIAGIWPIDGVSSVSYTHLNRSDRGQHENTAYQERSLKSQQIKRSPARESAAAQQRRHEQIDFETYGPGNQDDNFSSEAYKREKHSRAKKVKRDPDEATAFDKILAAIGSVPVSYTHLQGELFTQV